VKAVASKVQVSGVASPKIWEDQKNLEEG